MAHKSVLRMTGMWFEGRRLVSVDEYCDKHGKSHGGKHASNNYTYLDVTLFDLSVLDMLPQVIADGSDGRVHLNAKVTTEAYRSFVCRVFLSMTHHPPKKQVSCFIWQLHKNNKNWYLLFLNEVQKLSLWVFEASVTYFSEPDSYCQVCVKGHSLEFF